MIEATCGACGTVNRIAESDVPVGAKYMTCSSCKSRVVIPTQTQSNLTLAGTPPAGGNRGDIIDLADLPAPKKRNPLAGADGGGRAAPPPALASAQPSMELDDLLAPVPGLPPKAAAPVKAAPATSIADLPAPKMKAPPPIPKGPPSIALQAVGPLSVDDLPDAKPTQGIAQTQMGRSTASIEDLPAPRTQTSGLGRAAPGQAASVGDLPQARTSTGIAPSPRGPATSSIADLPSPKAAGGIGAAAPSRPMGVDDLPAPKGMPGLGGPPPTPPAAAAPPPPPVRPQPQAISDLPAPRQPARQSVAPPPAAFDDAIADLPAPKRGGQPTNLPMPKAGGGSIDLPMPKAGGGSVDLPMPKAGGGSIDLPTPKVSAPELPAPKGFFDDLPMPAAQQQKPAELPAPKGFFDDLPMPAAQQGSTQLPAPKGFFDDLPQAARSQGTQLPAPKGFFDDLPQASRSTTGLPSPSMNQSGVPQPAPGQLQSSMNQTGVVEPKGGGGGLFDDLDMPGGHAHHDDQASPLDMGSGSPDLDLGLAASTASSGAGDGAFDDLDLSKPSAPPIKFDAPKGRDSGYQSAQKLDTGGLPPVRGGGGDGMSLELEEPRVHTPKLGPKKPEVAAKEEPKNKAKRQRIVLGAALGLVAVGALVGFAVKRHAAAADRDEEISDGITAARKALSSPNAGHWQIALNSAKKVLDEDEENVEAIGIGAEAAYAGALDDGVNAAGRKTQGRNLLAKAREDGLAGPDIDRALIVESIASGQWDRAIGKLEPMVKANPKDGFLSLYLGWALAGKGDLQGAMKAFDATAQTNAALKIPALYGRGRAKLALADLPGARADFKEILATDKDHVGAQVGLAAALTATQAPQQESDLLAILARKDIDNADPRARIEAWVLAGDDARKAGRVDAARERYHKALAIDPNDVSATTGLAETELRDNKLDVASDLILKATSASQNDAHAQIVAAEIEIRMRKLDSAAQRIKLLADPARGLATMDKVRVKLVEGKLLEAREDDQGALAAWSEAATLAGDLDLTPTMTAIAKLTKLQQKAADEKNDAKVAQYREQADQLLGTLAQKAEQDPALALTLGIAYLDSNDAAKAEGWLRKAADARPTDPEAKYQLAKALVKLMKPDDAIEQLRAAIELDPNRTDIGLELAKTYEAAGRDPDAGMMYDKLLSKKDPSVELRARAGRFWARTSQLDRAAQQGDEILKVDPHNPAGLFLRGEKLLGAAKYDDAKKFYQQAVDADRDPQYLDGQGRCAEKIADLTKDTKFQELALRAYQAASELAPQMFNPLAGQGRVYIQREEWDKALVPLQAANKLRPDDLEVLINIGLALQKLNRTGEAVGFLDAANKIKPSPEASYHLGQLYFDQHKDANAAGSYELAIKLAEEAEKSGSPKVEWLDDAYYVAATIYGSNTGNNPSRQKALLTKFVQRGSKSAVRLDEAKRLLATTLRGVN